jgi:hypothetical protein
MGQRWDRKSGDNRERREVKGLLGHGIGSWIRVDRYGGSVQVYGHQEVVAMGGKRRI